MQFPGNLTQNLTEIAASTSIWRSIHQINEQSHKLRS